MKLTSEQIDALKELINIGVGRSAGMLNEMVNVRVYLQVPSVKVFPISETIKELEWADRDQLATIELGFKGALSGTAALVFPAESASNLVAILSGEELGSPDLDSVRVETLKEVGNIIVNGVMGSIGNVLGQRINYSLPTYSENPVEKLLAPNDFALNTTVLLVRTRFTVKEIRVEGDIILLFEVDSFNDLLAAIAAANIY